MNPVAPVTKYAMGGHYPAVALIEPVEMPAVGLGAYAAVISSRPSRLRKLSRGARSIFMSPRSPLVPRGLLLIRPEHDLVPARDRGAAAVLLHRPPGGSRLRLGVLVQRRGVGGLLDERGLVEPGPVVEEGLDRLVGDPEHVVAEGELVLVLDRHGGQPADPGLGLRLGGRVGDVPDQPAGVV